MTYEADQRLYERTRLLTQNSLHSVRPYTFLGRLRYQLFFGCLLCVVLPVFLYHLNDAGGFRFENVASTTPLGLFAAVIIATYLFRRVTTLPGVGMAGNVLPAVVAGYGIVLAFFFGLRLEYSRLFFGLSYVNANLFFFAVSAFLRRQKGRRLYLVPSPSTTALMRIPGIEWVMLEEPSVIMDLAPVLVADLRADLGSAWERLIAEMALSGNPVYHVKQVQESLTGRVAIEHLSENSFGSLLPNSSYGKIKNLVDLLAAALALPLLLLPMLAVAVLIKLETPGSAFFRQRRRGHRGKTFEVVKFRTMRVPDESAAGSARHHAITQSGDVRITRLGAFLRRTRIDELPQIWNILRGEMSWIGPRPEALALSDWYNAELPFYSYRHIVRPGISGWAQVNQGHVADLEGVYEKLHYDFYYIKNFSAWLDLLILARTVGTMFTGFGAK